MRVLVPIDLKDARHDSQTVVVASASLTSLFSLSTTDFRSAKFIVQATLGTEYVVREFLAIHDGTNGFITEYAIVSTDETSDLMDDVFSANVATGNFHLYVTPSTATSRTFKISVTLQ